MGRGVRPHALCALVAVAVTASTACGGPDRRPDPTAGSATPVPAAPAPTTLPPLVLEPTAQDLGPFKGAVLTVPDWGARATSCPSGRLRLGENGQYVGRSHV